MSFVNRLSCALLVLSGFLIAGLPEMKRISSLMGADLSLKFEESLVSLTMEMAMDEASPSTATCSNELPRGTVLICAGIRHIIAPS